MSGLKTTLFFKREIEIEPLPIDRMRPCSQVNIRLASKKSLSINIVELYRDKLLSRLGIFHGLSCFYGEDVFALVKNWYFLFATKICKIIGVFHIGIDLCIKLAPCLDAKFKIPKLSHRTRILHAWSIKSRWN